MNSKIRPLGRVCCFAIAHSEYEGRLDAQFYLPEHRESEKRMHASGYPVHSLGSPEVSTQVVDGPFGSDLKVDEYFASGVPLIRVSNCRTGAISIDEELVYITPEKHQSLIRSEVLPGDVLLTKAGHILGYTAVFPRDLERGNITSHLASIRPAQGVNSHYLAEFLGSDIGLQQIYRWGNKSTRPELNTDEVRWLLIVLPPEEVQMSLMNMMRTARDVRDAKLAESDALLASIDTYVLGALGIKLSPKAGSKFFAVSNHDVAGSRLDAFFYQPYLVRSEMAVRELKCGITPLRRLLAADLINGIDARAYSTAGRRYLRVQNVRPYEIHTRDVACISDVPRREIDLQLNDILLTRKGTFGIAARVEADDTDCMISSEIILLRPLPNSDVSTDFIVTWLNNTIMQRILDRHKTGAIMGHITQEVVADLPVPKVDKATQRRITDEVNQRRQEAQDLKRRAEAEWQTAKKEFESVLLTGIS